MLEDVLGAVDDDVHAADGVDGDTGAGGSGLIVHGRSLRWHRKTALTRILRS